ncbi:MAG: hypothetical protein JWM76_1685 [Pseudonocardiales bacterium]|nr:hypothetical protein [Pseudonocardiales bacterium]
MAEKVSSFRLRAVLEPRGPAGAVVLTDDQVATLGGSKSPPVKVTINGVTVPARIARMGGENLLGLSKKLRAQLGVEIGQDVDVVVALDAGPRVPDVPPALAQAFTHNPEAKAAFDQLAPSHQKEFARWVEEAKRDDTRRSRVEQTLEMLRDGRTRR